LPISKSSAPQKRKLTADREKRKGKAGTSTKTDLSELKKKTLATGKRNRRNINIKKGNKFYSFD